MTRIFWTHFARSDLQAIFAYISRDSIRFANRQIETIKLAVERLRNFPESGRVVEELEQPDVRELLVGNYRVIYRYSRNRVTILTVVHAARNFPGN